MSYPPPDENPWLQGSLLPAHPTIEPLSWVHPANPTTRAGRKAVERETRENDEAPTMPLPVRSRTKADDRMMVVTQTCDIVKSPNQLPQVEVARVFTTTNEQTIAQAQSFASARYFRLDDRTTGEAIVLDYGQRALLEKGFLGAVEPDNELADRWSTEQALLLARWLGHRYARPAIPDEDYEQITRPVRDAWRGLRPETAKTLNQQYAEWRYRRERDGTLTLYVLALDPEPDPIVGLEVADFLTRAIEPAYAGRVQVATDRRSYHTFTKADELSTRQISMEWASHDGDDSAATPA
ncbi:MAG: hypothetical protein AB7G37_13830 [Solirubrobacteraceae bacterium]